MGGLCIGFPQGFLFSVVFDGGNKAPLQKVPLQLEFILKGYVDALFVKSMRLQKASPHFRRKFLGFFAGGGSAFFYMYRRWLLSDNKYLRTSS